MPRNEDIRLVRIKITHLLELIHPRIILVLRQGLKRIETPGSVLSHCPVPTTASLPYLVARSIISSEIPQFPKTIRELKDSVNVLLQVHLLISEWITKIHGTNFCDEFRHILTEILALSSIYEYLDANDPLGSNYSHLSDHFREIFDLQIGFLTRYLGNRTLGPVVETAVPKLPPQPRPKVNESPIVAVNIAQVHGP